MNYVYAAIGAVLFGGGIYIGRLTVEVPAEKAVVQQTQAQVVQEAKQLQTNTQAEAQHDAETEHPPALILKQPVWLSPPANIVVQVPAQASTQPAAERPTDSRPAIDLRPQLAAFALKYENALSDCRRLSAEWPSGAK